VNRPEVGRRRVMTSLLDVLKEAEFHIGLTEVFHTIGTREVLDRRTLQAQLPLCFYGLGTNAGLKAVTT
jgi:hypothetical protein